MSDEARRAHIENMLRKEAAEDLAGAVNLSLGWRTASPEFCPVCGRYTGRIVLGARGLLGIIDVIETGIAFREEAIVGAAVCIAVDEDGRPSAFLRA